ncbi:nucleoside-diphosphate sugar epimerase/dehydratase [Rhodospirillales bacterium]|nr:nucleoside-diphosphate sugar epimerase/dehydratase [Rhodospirillales bacterium]
MPKIYNRANIAFTHDVFMASISFILALYLRLGNDVLESYAVSELIFGTILFTAIAAIVFRSLKMYRGVWQYASLNDLINITKSTSLVILIFVVISFVNNRLEDLPRSLPFINWFVLMALLGGPRFLYRLFKDQNIELRYEKNSHKRIPVLLVGAGDSADLFIRDLARGDSNYRVCGIISGTNARVGRNIQGVEILGTTDEIPIIFNDLTRLGQKPQRLVITSERVEKHDLEALLKVADSLGMTLARLPSLTDFKKGLTGSNEINIKPIDVEDLLGRPQTSLDSREMRDLITKRRVLITGAGGSIGSELVRQIANYFPSKIILVENSEFNLYTIDMELSNKNPGVARQALIGDVRDRQRMFQIFEQYKPELVFHAAALKHVPMVEFNMFEGMFTNVIGTKNVADAANKALVSTFVQISTDKAVNPSNIMGASKRIAESYCQALDLERGLNTTRFITVRFGNVLGSAGSVVALFRDQISKGGPVTVTDPKMKRYFMTVREAVELVLAASALGTTQPNQVGKIFVLEMGKPVLIQSLAEQMIRLAGHSPSKDIKIIHTGLRPGEKLFEEMFHDGEKLVETSQSGVMLAAPRVVDLEDIILQIDKINKTIITNDGESLIKIIHDLVPEYNPPS